MTFPTQPSALPSPPTSPTSPRTATTRIRIKVPRPGSISNVPSLPRSKAHAERTRRRSMSPSYSRIITAPDQDVSGSEMKTIGPATVVAGKRRQSSIAYYTPSSPSPWSQRPQLNKTLSSSVDSPHEVEIAGANARENVSTGLALSSRSPSTHQSVSSSDATGAREREPLTLVEKHADLLRFIAQKERKCLELRDQLAVHEKELAELKGNWERIVNRRQDPLPNPPLTAGIGVVAFDGLKEGVRMIAAGFSDLGGVIQEFESGDNDSSKSNPLTHAARDNITSNTCANLTGGERLSTSSVSSIQESMYASDNVLDCRDRGVMTVATAPSLARAGSLNCRMHKRTLCVIAKEPTTPTSPPMSSPAQSPQSAGLDVGMSIILAPSPTLVPPLLGAVSASTTPAPVMESTHGSVPTTAGTVSSWMDSMGKKLSDLHKGQAFSKGQKRASLILAGVSSTLSSALLPGPTATTPAPVPILTPATAARPRIKSSLTTRPLSLQSRSDSQAYPSYKSMTDWLDDDDNEETAHAGAVLAPDSKLQLRHTMDRSVGRDEAGATTVAVSSFDDGWNW